MVRKLGKPLETEDCFWPEASQKLTPSVQNKELDFTDHLSLEIDSSPVKPLYENAAQATPEL